MIMRSVIDSARIASQSPNLEGWASSRDIAVRWNHEFSFVSHSKRAGEDPLDAAWWTSFDHVHHSTHKALARLSEAPGEAWTANVIDMVEIHRSSIYWRILTFGDAQIHLRNSTPQARISNVDLKMDLWIFSWNIRLIRNDLEQEFPDLEFPPRRFQIRF